MPGKEKQRPIYRYMAHDRPASAECKIRLGFVTTDESALGREKEEAKYTRSALAVGSI